MPTAVGVGAAVADSVVVVAAAGAVVVAAETGTAAAIAVAGVAAVVTGVAGEDDLDTGEDALGIGADILAIGAGPVTTVAGVGVVAIGAAGDGPITAMASGLDSDLATAWGSAWAIPITDTAWDTGCRMAMAAAMVTAIPSNLPTRKPITRIPIWHPPLYLRTIRDKATFRIFLKSGISVRNRKGSTRMYAPALPAGRKSLRPLKGRLPGPGTDAIGPKAITLTCASVPVDGKP